jgi:hypothetical protein
VISKLFTRQMDRFSSAVYQVEGPWDDPEVNFQRIFDDSAELPGEEPDNEGKQQEKEASAAATEGL